MFEADLTIEQLELHVLQFFLEVCFLTLQVLSLLCSMIINSIVIYRIQEPTTLILERFLLLGFSTSLMFFSGPLLTRFLLERVHQLPGLLCLLQVVQFVHNL